MVLPDVEIKVDFLVPEVEVRTQISNFYTDSDPQSMIRIKASF